MAYIHPTQWNSLVVRPKTHLLDVGDSGMLLKRDEQAENGQQVIIKEPRYAGKAQGR